MEISAIGNLNSNCKSNKSEAKDKKCGCPICEEIQASSLDAMAAYNQAVIKPRFNPDFLPDKSLESEFDGNELCTKDIKDFSFYPIGEMADTFTKNCIRKFESNGELPWSNRQSVEEKYERMGIRSEEEKQRMLQEEMEQYAKTIKSLTDRVNEEMSKIPPTTKEHTVYRIITDDYSPSYKNIQTELSSLDIDDEFILDNCPIYVSTSGQKVMKNYGLSARDGFLFEIRLPKGSQLYKFPHDGIEQCIMKPQAKFKLIDKQEYANDFTYMILEYIPE